MRRGEEADVTRVVAGAGMPILATITGTGTLEGGSFVKLRPGVAAFGTSIRCNDEAAAQLREVLARIGWELLVVPLPRLHDPPRPAPGDGRRRPRARRRRPACRTRSSRSSSRRGIETIHPEPGEAWALNVLCLRPGRVLMAEGSPRTAERLDARRRSRSSPSPTTRSTTTAAACTARRWSCVREPAGDVSVDAAAVVARLRELDARSGGRRVAWGAAGATSASGSRAWLGRACPRRRPLPRPGREHLGAARRARRRTPWSSAATSTACPTAAGSTAASASSRPPRSCARPPASARASRWRWSTGPTRRARASAIRCWGRRRPAGSSTPRPRPSCSTPTAYASRTRWPRTASSSRT